MSRRSDDLYDYSPPRGSRSASGHDSSPDSNASWIDEDDFLAIPEIDPEREANADPLFPAPHKFDLMLHDYLKKLSVKKREKALLTQKMYDAVLNVLRDPKDTSTKTAQFRFWAKKMFQLTQYGDEYIVCHEKKPVAVKEQIFEVLVHCHGQAGHGGRDKTSFQVRRYYSWIPKEVIARFVRDCPLCQSRRTQSSASFGHMSDSQAFLIGLQSNTNTNNKDNKQSVSLAQARANAAALGHKPARRTSLRTVDNSRSRRGSALTDCVSYNDAPLSSDDAIFQMMRQPQMHMQVEDRPHQPYSGMAPNLGRANSYGGHYLGMHPYESQPEMLRRASTGEIPTFTTTTTQPYLVVPQRGPSFSGSSSSSATTTLTSLPEMMNQHIPIDPQISGDYNFETYSYPSSLEHDFAHSQPQHQGHLLPGGYYGQAERTEAALDAALSANFNQGLQLTTEQACYGAEMGMVQGWQPASEDNLHFDDVDVFGHPADSQSEEYGDPNDINIELGNVYFPPNQPFMTEEQQHHFTNYQFNADPLELKDDLYPHFSTESYDANPLGEEAEHHEVDLNDYDLSHIDQLSNWGEYEVKV
ncbi:hypothetical protein P7C73_g6746, partial [Tremellales sp. Uapishka_1]